MGHKQAAGSMDASFNHQVIRQAELFDFMAVTVVNLTSGLAVQVTAAESGKGSLQKGRLVVAIACQHLPQSSCQTKLVYGANIGTGAEKGGEDGDDDIGLLNQTFVGAADNKTEVLVIVGHADFGIERKQPAEAIPQSQLLLGIAEGIGLRQKTLRPGQIDVFHTASPSGKALFKPH